MPQISILGCGWLGFPLGQKLLELEYGVKGSTTSPGKIELLGNAGIEPFLIVLSEHQVLGDIPGFLLDSEILILDIPPRLRAAESENFVSKIRALVPLIENSNVKNVLFISSTSVYSDNDFGKIDENQPLNPETESGKQLAQVEEILRQNQHFTTTVLRFGGLIGDDRHPVYHLAGKLNIENPKAPINLIHQEDCIGIIRSVIEKNTWSETFNAVAPFHPTREDYYTKKAVDLNLVPPVFKQNNQSPGKIICSGKILKMLDYTFIHKTDI